MTFEIKKNVPIPAAHKSGRPIRFPLRDMEVGDCFDVPIIDGTGRGADLIGAGVGRTMVYFAKKSGRKFTRRKIGDVHRVWRIA